MRVPRLVAAMAVAGAGLAAASLLWGSRRWPLVHDAPIMHYVASRLLEGAVPYRDLFDMNFPFAYAAHAGVLVALGRGDAAFRCFDLAILALAAAGLWVALRDAGPGARPAAVALLALYHVAGGPWLAGQRDYLLWAPLAWMAAGLLAHARSGRVRPLGGAALALGIAAWIKPHALLLALLPGWAAWRHPRRARAVLAAAAGLAAPAVAALGWLAVAGGLPAFADVLGGYVLPLYSRLGREEVLASLRLRDYGHAVLAGLSAWTLLGALALVRARRWPALGVLAGGVAGGALHFVIQGRGWEYHFYPLALFALALGAAGLGASLAGGFRGLALSLALVLALTAGALAVKGGRNREPAWIRAKVARVDAVTDALRPLVAAGGTVQVLDTTDGGIHALYRLAARQPTRFLYDFHFFHDPAHPYVRRLRRELLAGLAGAPPAAVVLFERGWPAGGYERLAGFPELRDWLRSGYLLTREGDGWRLYEARRPAVAGAAGGGA